MYHGLDDDFRPLDDPSAEPKRIEHVDRYRCMMYGFGLAVDVLVRGGKDRVAPASPKSNTERVRPSGIILPTGVRA